MADSSSRDYSALHYRLPTEPADTYADRALTILQDFSRSHPKLLPYLLSSDLVLTLSGVRAYDTYVTFEGSSKKAIKQITDFMSDHGLSLFAEISDYEVPTEYYHLLNHSALEKLSERYDLADWFNPKPPYTMERFAVWSYHIEYLLRHHMSEGVLPREWLTDYLAAHDIRLGMLLGYPGEAIAACCWIATEGDGAWSTAVSADIAYHDAYHSAWPTYFFSEDIQDLPVIRQHQQLWSDILTAVYESSWHQELLKDQDFKRNAELIASLKEPPSAAE